MRSTREQNPLERYRDGISRCVRCGSCSAVCPVFQQDRRESQSPRGRIALIESVLESRIAVTDVYKDRLSTCTGCLACERHCASGVPVTGIIQAAKEEAFRQTGGGIIETVLAGVLQHDATLSALSWFAPTALRLEGIAALKGRSGVFPEVRSAMSGAAKNNNQKLKDRKSVLFYAGCAIRHFQPDIGRAAVTVLEHAGYSVLTDRGLICCGRPSLSLGDREGARKLAEHNVRLMASLGVEAIITACASCGLTLKEEYPNLLAQSGLECVPVLDIHEFLAGRMSGLSLDEQPRRVTWHDPCHLARGQGLAKTARTILRSVPSVTLIEMEQPDRCCGFGSIGRGAHLELFRNIGRSKAFDIMRTKAPLVVTGCPACRMQIADSLIREGAGVAVVHTVQLMAAVLRKAERGLRSAELEKIGI